MTVLLVIITVLLFFIELDLTNISSSIDDLRRSNAEKMSHISGSIDDLRRKIQYVQKNEGVKTNDKI